MSVKCPKCRSNEITGGTKGFGAGKAVAGLVVAGPVGLVAGAIGKNKAMNTCMSCGKRWNPAAQANKDRLANQTGEEKANEFLWGLGLVAVLAVIWGLISHFGFGNVIVWGVVAIGVLFCLLLISIPVLKVLEARDGAKAEHEADDHNKQIAKWKAENERENPHRRK